MSRNHRQLLRWHVWLGWLIGVPLVLWTVTGLVMVARPIDEVRGTTLRIERAPQPVRVSMSEGQSETLLREGRLINQRGRSVLIATFVDGSVHRIDLQSPGQVQLRPVDEAEARAAVAYAIKGGDLVAAVKLFPAEDVPLDFRKPLAVWQVTLADGTHVYVGRDSGEIEAVRTRWWRVFDFMWGLHIMDLQTREDTHHPILVLFAALASIGSILGCILMIRRYSQRPSRA